MGDRAGLDGSEKAHLHVDSIPNHPAEKRNLSFDLIYDLQMKHHQMKSYTATLNSHNQFAVAPDWAPQHIFDILLMWYVQTTIVLTTCNNQSNTYNYI